MKYIFLCSLWLILIIQSTVAFAQDDEKYKSLISPGVGIGEINIGSPYSKVVEILGEPSQKRPIGKEKQALIKQKLNPNKELVFFIGFDYVAEYNNTSNRSEYPIYTLYFKNDTLVYMIISSYGYDNDKYKKFGISSGLFFGDDKDKMKKLLGKGFVKTSTKSGFSLFDYLEQGISFFFEKNELRTMHIYAPLSHSKAKDFMTKNY